jgi:predicted pyridoxine 5'-phosphate oxidase superfamily flavin-nucleotide-binding protein
MSRLHLPGQIEPDVTPFHAGERRAQALAGVEAAGGGRGIRTFMPDQHRLFFAQLPFAVVATVDAAGAPVATLLAGGEGFIASPNPNCLAIAARSDDPSGAELLKGRPFAQLGIEPHTRRRNRAHGAIAWSGDEGLIVGVEQSFGNCPQYIHERRLELVPPGAAGFERFTGLPPHAAAQVSAADTFFVATASGPGVPGGGVDISHRGGPPGFVRVEGGALLIPEYRGTRYFTPLGNLLLTPRAALLFVDFEAGRLLQLQGSAEVFWDRTDLPGAERVWRFEVERGWRGSSPIRQAAVQPPSTESAAPVVDAPMSETR